MMIKMITDITSTSLCCGLTSFSLLCVVRGSAFARRRREREIELESDEKDRQHEREEIEALRLNMMKKQVEGTEQEDEEVSSAIIHALFRKCGYVMGCLLLIKHEKK